MAPEPLRFFEQTLPPQVRMAEVGSIYEWRADTQAFEIGRRVARGGGALIIDYGHIESMVGDTFQALHNQRKADPLAAVLHAYGTRCDLHPVPGADHIFEGSEDVGALIETSLDFLDDVLKPAQIF